MKARSIIDWHPRNYIERCKFYCKSFLNICNFAESDITFIIQSHHYALTFLGLDPKPDVGRRNFFVLTDSHADIFVARNQFVKRLANKRLRLGTLWSSHIPLTGRMWVRVLHNLHLACKVFGMKSSIVIMCVRKNPGCWPPHPSHLRKTLTQSFWNQNKCL
jgi:hypothetical protein